MIELKKQDDSEARILMDLRALVENFPPPPARPLDEWDRNDDAVVRAIGIAWGWLMRVLRTAEATRILETDGYAVECAPMRRSLVEHVIRLHWATTVDTRTFVEAALNKRKHSLEYIKRAAKSGTPLSDGALNLVELLQSETDPENEKISFKDLTSLMKDVPDYQILYQIWLTETQESHATITSSASYVDFTDEPATHLHMEPSPRNRFAAMLPSMVLLATESYAHLAGISVPMSEPLAIIRERVARLGSPIDN